MKLTANQPVYQLPPYEEVIRASIHDVSVRLIDHGDMLEFYKDQPTTLAGRPIFYSLFHGSMYLFPPPDEGYNLVLRYVPSVVEE